MYDCDDDDDVITVNFSILIILNLSKIVYWYVVLSTFINNSNIDKVSGFELLGQCSRQNSVDACLDKGTESFVLGYQVFSNAKRKRHLHESSFVVL